ncbi:trans-1,2-dihydrobenzene-1,2-diol dehydrogenase-like [Haliotis cracherodii]|uniref:trans-1,2-dihydrobenzene-1,2-diol dehydrogenase-like n=1 Tax=Haliotis cracherodii TaxID=6455 RepID=UPI0039ECF19D
MATRWGILSAGKISHDFTSALVSQNPEEHQVVAVAARSADRAKEFADKFGIKSAYGSYEELVKNPDVEIIYIGSIHPEHYKMCLLCLDAGKHVLCEKPMTLTSAQTKLVLKTAKEKKLFFMEGFWSRFFPVYEKVREELSSNSIGDIILIQNSFCVNIYDIARINDKRLGGGGLMDIGCYCVMMADMIFKERPEKIVAEGEVTKDGVDAGGAITLRFSGDRIASIVYHTKTQSSSNSMLICGTKGCIKVEDPFWCPTKMTSPSGVFEFPLPTCKLKMHFSNSEGFQYEQRCVRDCLKKGELECPLMSHASSENIIFIIETALQQMGVQYNTTADAGAV